LNLALNRNKNHGLGSFTKDYQHSVKLVFFYGLGLLSLIFLFQLFMILHKPSIWIAWFSLIIYLVFGGLTYKKTPTFFWLFFLFYFGQGIAIISCVYLESGNYISEQAVFAYVTGATSRLVMYNLIFFLAGLVMFTLYIKNGRRSFAVSQSIPKLGIWTICLGLSLLLTILYIGLYIYGVPLFEGLDRYRYWADHPMPVFRLLSGQVYLLLFLLGILFAHSKRRIYLVLLIGCCVYLILQSVKFSGLFIVGYLFLLPIIITRLTKGKLPLPLKSIGIYAIVICSLFLSVIYYHYSAIHYSPDLPITESIANRVLGLQGHVWWGTDVEVMNRNRIVDFDQLSKEFSSFMSFSPEDEDVGMKYLMSLVAPPYIAQAYLEKGVNFTMGYPAIGLYIFNYVGLAFLQIIVAAIVVVAIAYVYQKITRYQLIRAAVAIKIFIEIYGAFTIGNFYQLFSLKVVIYVLISIFLESVVFLGNKRKFA